MMRTTRYEAIAVAVLLAISLVLRTADLGVFIASDELRWTCRSLLFRDAIARGAWTETYQVGHPGVITMWLGTLTLPASDSAVETCVRSEGVEHISQVAETLEGQTQRMAELGQLLPYGRLGVGIFTWLCLILVWALVRRAIGSGVALLGLAALGLDPFLVAHSRFLHLDAVTAMLSLAALVGLLLALDTPPGHARNAALVMSGATAGLAMLEKSPALFLGAFAALSLGVVAVAPLPTAWRAGKTQPQWSRLATNLITWGGAAVVVYVLLWPAMWVAPLGTLQGMLAKASGYALGGHEPGNFFFGRINDDPGPLFYPVALAFRLTPIACLGLVGIIYGVRRKSWMAAPQPTGKRERRAAVLLLAFGVAFVAFMTAGAKKFDRYVLPAIVAFDLAAAVGLVWLARAAAQRYARVAARRAVFLAAAVIAAIQLIATVAYHPYYLTAYNPLLGGAPVARRAILVGWGEGYDQAAAYLDAQPGASNAEVATPGVSNFMPLFSGQTRSMTSYRPWRSDYVVFYLSHVQRRHDPEVLERYLFNPEREPDYVVRLAGIDYVWIYGNTSWRAPLDVVLGAARPGDALMTNGTSLIRKHYSGDLPQLYVYGHWAGPETAELLDQVPPDVARIWYVRYTATDPRPIQQTLHRRAVLGRYEAFPDVELYLYRLAQGVPDALDTAVGYGNSPGAPVLQLTGAGVVDGALRWDQDNLLRLSWQLVQATSADYHVRLRLTGADGYLWADTEDEIVNARLAPTSEWPVGEHAVDGYRLTPPAGLPPGEYRLEVDVLAPTQSTDDDSGAPAATEAPPLVSLAPTGDVTLSVRVAEPAAAVTWEDVAPAGVQRLDAQLDQTKLVGVQLGAGPAVAGQTLPVGLVWRTADNGGEERQLELTLRGLDGQTWATWCGQLAPTDQAWSRSGHNLLLDPSAGGTARLSASVDGSPESAVGLVTVVAPEPRFELPATMQHRTDYRLGDDVVLLGYDASSTVIAPGGSLGVTLYWQAGGPVSPVQKVFVHLLGPDGQLYGQKDNEPLVGRRATTAWEPGEVLADPYVVEVDPTAPAGTYLLTAGMYDPTTADRLPALDEEGNRLPGDRITLATIEVR